MGTNYGMETSGPKDVNIDQTLNMDLTETSNVPKENAMAPMGYGKRLYAKAKRIYREAKESFERDDEQGKEKYDALVGISMIAIGLATGSGGLALLGALVDAIGIGWGLGGLGGYYASFTVSDREDGKKAAGRGGLL